MRESQALGQITLEVFLGSGKVSVWTSAKVREGDHEVEPEDEDRQSIVQDILRKSTDFLMRIIVPVEGVTLSYVSPHCHRFPLEDHTWWFSSKHGKKPCNWWCAACGGQYKWKAPNRSLVMQDSTDLRKAMVFRAHAAPQGMCDNLDQCAQALDQPAERGRQSSQDGGTGLQERSRLKIMDGLRKFIVVDKP